MSFRPPSEPPWEWETTLYGRPFWIVEVAPEQAEWAAVTPDFGQMPRLRAPESSPLQKSVGRRPLVTANPHGVAWAAYAKDFLGFSFGRIAREKRVLLANDGGDKWRSRGAQRYVDVGRRLLSARGIAPWCIWQEGPLPTSWWTTMEFVDALSAWAYGATPDQRLVITIRPKGSPVEQALHAVGEVLRAPQGAHRELWKRS